MERGIVEEKTDELVPCQCGFKPDHVSIGYSRTPYDVFCPTCKKQTQFAKCATTGHIGNAIDYWNNHVAKLTLEEMKEEYSSVKKDKLIEDPYNEYKIYQYYWYKGTGEELDKRCF